MDRTQGYPLPDGELGNDEIACTLVFYPDRNEYRAALQGSLAYLATWIAWEKDTDKRGKDAADNWREAYELTTECWRMACLEQLQDDVAAIRLLLQQQACCGSTSITYSPTLIVTTTIVPNVGNDPSFYGETAVSDWEEWLEHLCYQSHVYVDRLIHWGETIDYLQTAGGLTLDAWSQIIAWMNFAGLAVPVYLGEVMSWLSEFFLDVTSTWFDSVAADLEAARDDIVCALRFDGDLGLSISNAVGSGSLAWILFYSLIDYDNVKAVLYEGGADDVYLPTETRDDCDCEVDALFEFVWVDPDKQQWNHSTAWQAGNLLLRADTAAGETNCRSDDDVGELETRFGISAPLVVNFVSFDFYIWQGTAPMRYTYFFPRIYKIGGLIDCPTIFVSSYNVNQWYHYEWHLGEDATIDPAQDKPIRIQIRKTSSSPNDQGLFLQNLKYAYIA